MALLDPVLSESDPEIAALIAEETPEDDTIRLIASENYASRAVLEATRLGAHQQVLRGLPAQALLRGPAAESTRSRSSRARASRRSSAPSTSTCSRTRGAPPTSPSTSRSCKPGETIMGLGLPSGGHLTHGWNVSITGKFFKALPTACAQGDHRIDMDQVRDLAREHRPKLLWCGTTAYPRALDFAAFRAIADEVGRDPRRRHRAHRRPRRRRRAPVARRHRRRRHLDDAQDLPRPARRHDPLQGRARGGHRPRRVPRPSGRPAQPHHRRHRGRRERGRAPSFKAYAQRIVENAKALGEALAERGFGLITGGTDNHLLLIDMTPQGRRRQAATRRRSSAAGIVAQLQLHPVRSAQALRSVGPPHRHAGGHVARHGRGRDERDRRLDGSRSPSTAGDEARLAGHRRRGEGALREVSGAGHSPAVVRATKARGAGPEHGRGERPRCWWAHRA